MVHVRMKWNASFDKYLGGYEKLYELGFANAKKWLVSDGGELSDEVVKRLDAVLRAMYEGGLTVIMDNAESPIELQVGMSLYMGIFAHNPFTICVPPPWKFNGEQNQSQVALEYIAFWEETKYWLVPNCWVNEKIRCDFLICSPISPLKTALIIECDGYKYHGDSSQFTKDKKRERELVKMGFPVLRFSGQEINANPIAVAQEIIDALPELVLSKNATT